MRALLLVLDSVGIGGAPDAAQYGDEGADTLGHILDRHPELKLPNLWSMGLGHIVGRDPVASPEAGYGRMREVSAGKDSTTGHWELAGAIVDEPFGLFERFPPELVAAIEADAGVRFVGNYPASGTEVIEELGGEHLRTGRPILYTSADSVLQIAAHEEVIPVERLYEICRVARRHADGYRIGRVIARPFVGEPGAFTRTPRRHDFSMQPPRTVLNAVGEAGLPVKGVGKIFDLFAGAGITESHPTESNADGMRRTDAVWRQTDRGLVFTNLVDFDAAYGHRRDVSGYARALAEFDDWLGGFLAVCRPEDLFIVTADHGNDPTFRGTDHTREEVPVMVRHAGRAEDLGRRQTLADVAATLAAYFGLPESWPVGTPFFEGTSTGERESDEERIDDVPARPPWRPRPRRRDDRREEAWRPPEPPGPRTGRATPGPPGAPADPGDLLQPDGPHPPDGPAAGRSARAAGADPGRTE